MNILVYCTKEAIKMIRTTISLHGNIFKRVKELAHQSSNSLGETISELLSIGLQIKTEKKKQKRKPLLLKTYPLGQPRIALEDKEAITDLINKALP